MIAYSEIVIGSTLEALLFAFNKRIPVFYTQPPAIPFRFDYLKPNQDFSFIGFEPVEKKLEGSGELSYTVGLQKRSLWQTVLFALSVDGLRPVSGVCRTIRNNGDTIVCMSEYSKIGEFTYNKCYFFGDERAENFVKSTADYSHQDKLYTVYDWISIRRGGKIPIDYMESKDHLCNKIWLYPSDRVEGSAKRGVKDACVVSTIKDSNLLKFEYSETAVKFKMLQAMKNAGFRGVLKVMAKNSPWGKDRYVSIAADHAYRYIKRVELPLSIISEPLYPNIHTPEVTLNDLLVEFEQTVKTTI